jgi:hypothetical protein
VSRQVSWSFGGLILARSAMKDTADAIGELVALFLPHCADRSTLFELKAMTSNPKQWREAHKLFSRIRGKTLTADKTSNRRLQIQYSFEEFCAKTLYNIADHSEGFSSAYLPPFDEDAPLYVVPCAIALSQELGIDGFSFDSVKARIDIAGRCYFG